ncbi:MAG TPA: CsgG/HfaB family protein [Gemmatimonadaceae bacterium]|nr:CsgG/HfaB family protein [Gemmatimonadaceae bacterium]
MRAVSPLHAGKRLGTVMTRHVMGIVRAVALATAAVICLATPHALFAAHQAQRPTVAVMYFNNGALMQHADYQPLSKGIADVLITELSANDSIRVVERDQLQKLLDEQNLDNSNRVDQATAVKIGKILGAQHMIFGGFVIDMKGRMRLDARAVNVETSEIEYVTSVSDKADDILAAISTLAQKMNSGMKLPGLHEAVPPAPPTQHSSAALKSLILYARALGAQDSKQPQQAATLYKQFLKTSPSTILVAQRHYAEAKLSSRDGSS